MSADAAGGIAGMNPFRRLLSQRGPLSQSNATTSPAQQPDSLTAEQSQTSRRLLQDLPEADSSEDQAVGADSYIESLQVGPDGTSG